MRLGELSIDDFLAYFFRKGNIHQMVSMNMSDLAFTDPIFQAAKAMRGGVVTTPSQDVTAFVIKS